jgi:ABC-type multidrug transport system permease subunit
VSPHGFCNPVNTVVSGRLNVLEFVDSCHIFICWYHPIGLFRNAEPTNEVSDRAALMVLSIWTFMVFTSTCTDLVIASIESPETAGNVAQLMFSLLLIFCGQVDIPVDLLLKANLS